MRHEHRSHIALLIFGLLFLMSSITYAQTSNATLQGSVTDPKGSVIPNATVKAQSADTGLTRTAVTEDSGFYVINFLPVGTYIVTAESKGFKTTRLTNITLAIGQIRSLDISLEVGGVEQTVEITDSPPPLDRNSATIGSVVQSSQIKELPLNGRNWAGLMLLAPGAINTGEGNHLSTRFVGRSRDDNNWTFDGVDSTGVKDPRQGANLRLVISTDSISEFRVNSTLYGADSGSGAGGQVLLVSRSGTNKLHGSVFEFLRNDVFDARVFTDPGELPPFRLNQFGGRIRTADANIDQAVTERRLTTREDSFAGRIDHRLSEKDSIYGRYSVDDAVLQVPLDAGVGLRTDNVRPHNFVLQWQRIFSPTVINDARLGLNRSPLFRVLSGPFDEEFSVSGFMTLENNQEVTEAGTSYSLIDNLAIILGRHNLKFGGEIRRIHVNVGEGGEGPRARFRH
jgi:hypothetical protein